ncbi:MAG: Nif3-like dinuclear metal center hexameric protein [Oscillospiraceae bacterium]|nr:Nif3-like dinuclear metal center hexameric protein [Oscillospiraceae bacterium]
MTTVTTKQVLACMEQWAPMELAEGWDNPGLLVDCDRPVRRILTALDITGAVVQEAAEKGCEMIVCHHPVIFQPLKRLTAASLPMKLAQAGISAVCMHTNLDAADGGVNDLLAARFGLTEVEPFAVLGRVGTLPQPMDAVELAELVSDRLNTPVKWVDGGTAVRRLALVGGAAGGMWTDAMAAGADALLTGEVSHHAALDAAGEGFTLMAAGHFGTEWPVAEEIARRLGEAVPGVEVLVSETNRDPFDYL